MLNKNNVINLIKSEVKSYFPDDVFLENNNEETRKKVRDHFKKFVSKLDYNGTIFIFCDQTNNNQYYIDLNFFILSFRIDSTILEFKIRNVNQETVETEL